MKPVWILTCATALALGVTSVATGAVGDPVLIGKRNAALGQTAMVGTSTTYATRQSNNQEGDGGAPPATAAARRSRPSRACSSSTTAAARPSTSVAAAVRAPASSR